MEVVLKWIELAAVQAEIVVIKLLQKLQNKLKIKCVYLLHFRSKLT